MPNTMQKVNDFSNGQINREYDEHQSLINTSAEKLDNFVVDKSGILKNRMGLQKLLQLGSSFLQPVYIQNATTNIGGIADGIINSNFLSDTIKNKIGDLILFNLDNIYFLNLLSIKNIYINSRQFIITSIILYL